MSRIQAARSLERGMPWLIEVSVGGERVFSIDSENMVLWSPGSPVNELVGEGLHRALAYVASMVEATGSTRAATGSAMDERSP